MWKENSRVIVTNWSKTGNIVIKTNKILFVTHHLHVKYFRYNHSKMLFQFVRWECKKLYWWSLFIL